jgi:membrane protein DedA with SNARE-associated domain
MQQIIPLLQDWIGNYGFFGVLLAGIIEEIISPIPSSLIQGAAGAILFSGVPVTFFNVLHFLLVVPVASAIGVTLGSLPYVWVSRVVGLKVIDRYGKYIRVSRRDIELLSEKMKNTVWDDVLFIGFRAFPLVPNVALAIYSGIIKMPYKKYMILSFIGVFIRGMIVGSIGWLASNQITQMTTGITRLEHIGYIGIAIIIFYVLYKKYVKKNPETLN